jgi:malate/lactate dehydrogenase
VRVADDVCASLPCVLGPDGASEPLWPVMNGKELEGWDHSLDVLREAGKILSAPA